MQTPCNRTATFPTFLTLLTFISDNKKEPT